MNKVIICYTRVSTEEQVKGYSLSAQKNELESYVKVHFPGKAYEVITDEGYSATNLERPGIKKVLEMIKSGHVEDIVVKSVDRLSRNVEDNVNIRKILLDNGINQIISMYVIYDLLSARGTRAFYEDAVDSQHESDRIGERSRFGLKEKARQGKYAYCNCPFGFVKDEDHYLHWHEENIKIVRDMFDYYTYEKKSELETHYYILDKYGMKFSKTNIRTFLLKTVYQGYIEASGERFDIVTPLFTEEDMRHFNDRGKLANYSKHQYKYRNKVFINGKRARHETKYGGDKSYKYYYVRGIKEISETVIDEAIQEHSITKYCAYNVKFRDKLNDISHGYIMGLYDGEVMLNKVEAIKNKIFPDDMDYINKIEIKVNEQKELEKIKVL